MSHWILSNQVWLGLSCILYSVSKFCCSYRLTGQDTTIRLQPSTSQPDSLPQPPAHSDFPHPQPPRPSLPVGQPPMGPGPPPGVPPHFPGPLNQPSAPVGPGSQGELRSPMHGICVKLWQCSSCLAVHIQVARTWYTVVCAYVTWNYSMSCSSPQEQP